MIPISPKFFFSPSEWGDFSKDEEDFQTSTTQKSSWVAQAVFSSPSQSIKDRDLPHSLDFTDYLLSPSDIQSKDMSYYEQGPFSPEDLVVESTGYKRLRSPINESRVSKRICLSKPKDCQDLISVSDEFDSEEQSVLQMDGFSQMVQTAEVLDPSREEWMSGPPLDSNEEFTQFMQEELLQIEANSVDGNEKEADEEIERRLSLLDTIGRGSSIETPQIKEIKKFDEQSIPLEDRFVLNALYESRGLFGACRLATKIKHKIPTIGRHPVMRILEKYDLGTAKKRTAEHCAGWPRFNAMPLPIEPFSEKSIPLLFRRSKMNNPILEEAVVKLAIKNPDWTREEIANELNKSKEIISVGSVYRILMAKNLTTRKQRREAAPNFDEESPQFRQRESFQIEQNSGNEKEADEEELSVLQTIGMDSHTETLQVERIEKFDEQSIPLNDRFVLNAIYDSGGFLKLKDLVQKTQDKAPKITSHQIEWILKKYDLRAQAKRIAEHDAGWPRFNAMPLPIEPGYEESIPLVNRTRNTNIDPKLESAILRLAYEKPDWSDQKITNGLKDQGFVISKSTVDRILMAKNLTTRQQRKEAAEALSEQDQTISDSLDLPDSAFSPSSIFLEDFSEEQISNVLRPFDAYEHSIPQLDHFSKMADTWEVLTPSREERVGESPLNFDEESIQFTQGELFQIEANSGNEKEADEEEFSVLQTVGMDSHTETPPIERMEKFDEQKISLKDRIVLNAVYESRGLLGRRALAKELNKKNVMVSIDQVKRTLKKYDLATTEKRKEEHISGWPRFNAMPFPIEPGSEKSIRLPYKRFRSINNPIVEGTVVRLALENPKLSHKAIANQLKGLGFFISKSPVDRILAQKNLRTLGQRQEAAKTLSTQDQTLSDSLDLSDYAFSPSNILLEDSNEEQISSVLKPFDANQQSISQLDHFSQMADAWEALAPSREQRIGESPLDSDEESIQFMQEELFQIEANSDLQEAVDGNEKEANGEGLSLLETVGMSSHMTTPQVKRIEKFDEEKISLKDRIVLNAIHESRGLDGTIEVYKKLVTQGETIVQKEVNAVFHKFKLISTRNRIAAIEAGWPAFNNPPPFYIEPSSHNSAPLPSQHRNTQDPILQQEALMRLIRKYPDLDNKELANLLKEEDIIIAPTQVYLMLRKIGLSTIKKRLAAHEAGWPGSTPPPSLDKALSTQDQTLSDSLDLPDSAFTPSSIVLEDTNEEQINSVLRQFEDNQQSIPQLDCFSQIVNTSEVLTPSREEMIDKSPLNSDEELFQIEPNSDLQENIDGNEKKSDEEELSVLQTVGMDSHTERLQIEQIEKFDEQKISINDRFVLNAIYESRGLFGVSKLTTKIKHKTPTITKGQIKGILKKYDLGTKEKRTGEHSAGWPRFNAMPLPIEPVLETVRLDSHTETLQIEQIEKFDEQKINLNDRFVLNAIYDSAGFLPFKDLVQKIQEKATKITSQQIEFILKKYDLGTKEKRTGEHSAGWPRFNAMPLPIEPGSKQSIPLVNRGGRKSNIDPKLKEDVIRLAIEKPDWSSQKITDELKKQGFVICNSTVYRVLTEKKLTTRRERKEAAGALLAQHQTSPQAP